MLRFQIYFFVDELKAFKSFISFIAQNAAVKHVKNTSFFANRDFI